MTLPLFSMQKAPGLLPHVNSGEGGCDIEFSAQFIVSNADANTEGAEHMESCCMCPAFPTVRRLTH